jgi:hypothetical protein
MVVGVSLIGRQGRRGGLAGAEAWSGKLDDSCRNRRPRRLEEPTLEDPVFGSAHTGSRLREERLSETVTEIEKLS